MHTKFRLGAAALAAALGPLALAVTGCSRARQATGFPAPVVNSQAQSFTPAEWKRLESVSQRLEQTQTLSSADIAFATSLLHSKPPVDTPRVEEDRQRMTLAFLCGTRPKKLTPALGRQLFSAVLPATSSPAPVVRTNAMLVLASSHDSRAIGILHQRAQNDPDPFNRKFAGSLERKLRAVLKPP